MGDTLNGEIAKFTRVDYPPASKSRSLLSIMSKNSSSERKRFSFGSNDILSIDTDAKAVSFLDNKKVSPEMVERSNITISRVTSPFYVTPSLFREIMTKARAGIGTKEMLQTVEMSMVFGSRPTSNDLDALARKMVPDTELKMPPPSTIPCGDKKCCAASTSFEMCNCDSGIVEISPSKDTERWYRIPRCISRYENLESMFTSDNNQIKAVENLEGMKHLKNLDLNGSRLDTAAGIEDSPSIERLFLRNVPLDTIKGIEKLPALRSLDISHDEYLHDITPVKGLKNLKHLFVDWKNINDESASVVKNMMKNGVYVNLA